MTSWKNKGKSSSWKSNSLKHLKPILCSGPENETCLWKHISHSKQRIKSCQDFLPWISSALFSPQPSIVSIKRQVLRRADFSFAVDNKTSAFPWQGLERKTRDRRCCHDEPEVTAMEREEAVWGFPFPAMQNSSRHPMPEQEEDFSSVTNTVCIQYVCASLVTALLQTKCPLLLSSTRSKCA